MQNDIYTCHILYHSNVSLAMDDPIHLGRDPVNECEGVPLMCQQCDIFPRKRFIIRENTLIRAVIGPSANPRGYTGITGDHCMSHSKVVCILISTFIGHWFSAKPCSIHFFIYMYDHIILQVDLAGALPGTSMTRSYQSWLWSEAELINSLFTVEMSLLMMLIIILSISLTRAAEDDCSTHQNKEW